jgi:hypothetical protein
VLIIIFQSKLTIIQSSKNQCIEQGHSCPPRMKLRSIEIDQASRFVMGGLVLFVPSPSLKGIKREGLPHLCERSLPVRGGPGETLEGKAFDFMLSLSSLSFPFAEAGDRAGLKSALRACKSTKVDSLISPKGFHALSEGFIPTRPSSSHIDL